MKTVRITEAFTGYPTGKVESERAFAVGEEPELSIAFADIIIEKGHAEEVAAKKAVPTAPSKSKSKGDDA